MCTYDVFMHKRYQFLYEELFKNNQGKNKKLRVKKNSFWQAKNDSLCFLYVVFNSTKFTLKGNKKRK